MGGIDIILWGLHGEYPAAEEARLAEWRLLVFGTWLFKAGYASGTVVNYIGAVKKWHQQATGLPEAALGIVFYRLPTLFRVIKKLNPAKQRDKTPWEFGDFESVQEGWRSECRQRMSFQLQPRSPAREYRLAVAWEVMKTAFQLLLRLAEVVTTVPPSVAMRDPLKWIDVIFEDAQGNPLEYDEKGRPVGCPVKARLREPPSKTRGGGGVMVLPFPNGWQSDRFTLAAGPGLFRFQREYPVPREHARSIPLFGMSQFTVLRPFVVPLSQQAFVTSMRALCRGAEPTVRYAKFGLHAWRVGGTNRLIDIGATAPQVCAAGRWMGDCWVLYARRQRKVIEELTMRMTERAK